MPSFIFLSCSPFLSPLAGFVVASKATSSPPLRSCANDEKARTRTTTTTARRLADWLTDWGWLVLPPASPPAACRPLVRSRPNGQIFSAPLHTFDVRKQPMLFAAVSIQLSKPSIHSFIHPLKPNLLGGIIESMIE